MRIAITLSVTLLVLTSALFIYQRPPHDEPLADPVTLAALIKGEEPQAPQDAQYGEFHGNPVTPPTIASLKQFSKILGVTTQNKRIEVDLARQRLYAYEDGKKVYEFVVSTGKWGRTPPGTYTIWVKMKSTLMSGGEGSDYYYLPNVPWVQFFYNDQVAKSRGYSLHGTYWHNNFGHPMSHGCVNLRTEDAATLFAWTSPPADATNKWAIYPSLEYPGTEINIYGEPPEE